MVVKQQRQIMEHLVSIPADEERLILATGRYIGEGFDDARLYWFNTMGYGEL